MDFKKVPEEESKRQTRSSSKTKDSEKGKVQSQSTSNKKVSQSKEKSQSKAQSFQDIMKKYQQQAAEKTTIEKVKQDLEEIYKSQGKYDKVENYETMYSLIDLTTLNANDTDQVVEKMCDQINNFKQDSVPNVAAICVYPPFVKLCQQRLKAPNVNIASVSAGFPSSQTFIDVKVLETEQCVKNGADEIDIVISIGKFLEGNKETVFNEIKQLKQACGSKAHLKVILETGALETPENIREASLIAMEAGADFIKTSTGKWNVNATPEAVYVMCSAIKEFQSKTNHKVGVKVAGGVQTAEHALKYFTIVAETLGTDFTNNKFFRIGASKLATNLLDHIASLKK